MSSLSQEMLFLNTPFTTIGASRLLKGASRQMFMLLAIASMEWVSMIASSMRRSSYTMSLFHHEKDNPKANDGQNARE